LGEVLSIELTDRILLLQSPGIVINGKAYDPESWRNAEFSQEEPGRLRHLLVDTIPAFSMLFAPTQSGSGSVLTQWRRLLNNYQWYDKIWERELCLLERIRPRIADLELLQAALFERYLEVVDETEIALKLCLREYTFALCQSRNATVWQGRVANAREEYEHASDWTALRIAELNRLYTRNGEMLLSEASTILRNEEETRSGTKDFAESVVGDPYARAQFTPNDWWTWFVSTDQEESDAVSEATGDFVYLEVSERSIVEGEFDLDTDVNPLYHQLEGDAVSLVWPLIGDNVYARGDNVTVSFEIATVDVDRPWLDLTLLRVLDPLRIAGTKQYQWSDGTTSLDNEGEFPLVVTQFVVARNICVSADRWQGGVPRFGSSNNVNSVDDNQLLGPFTVGGDFFHFSSGESSLDVDTFQPNPDTNCIVNAQIIAWTAEKMPPFPHQDALPEDWTPDTCDKLLSTLLPPLPFTPLPDPDPPTVIPLPPETPVPTPPVLYGFDQPWDDSGQVGVAPPMGPSALGSTSSSLNVNNIVHLCMLMICIVYLNLT